MSNYDAIICKARAFIRAGPCFYHSSQIQRFEKSHTLSIKQIDFQAISRYNSVRAIPHRKKCQIGNKVISGTDIVDVHGQSSLSCDTAIVAVEGR